jgi:hypothetical protein
MQPSTIPALTVTPTQSTQRSERVDEGRRFRPDIEGLRAVAVGLVLVFHAYGTPFSGGFVGVDVFFVISGFLITGILMREHSTTGRVSILGFYGRRVRRILPASALVVVTTVIAAYYFLGFLTGNDVAVAATWTAVFAANIHFGLVGTDYFGSTTDTRSRRHSSRSSPHPSPGPSLKPAQIPPGRTSLPLPAPANLVSAPSSPCWDRLSTGS